MLSKRFEGETLVVTNRQIMWVNVYETGTAFGGAEEGGWYYSSAACSLKHAWGGRSGLSDVLEKLSLKFGMYVEILRYMKNRSSNFFSFHFKFSDEEISGFQNKLSKGSKN